VVDQSLPNPMTPINHTFIHLASFAREIKVLGKSYSKNVRKPTLLKAYLKLQPSVKKTIIRHFFFFVFLDRKPVTCVLSELISQKCT
jgi:hypothetical protein